MPHVAFVPLTGLRVREEELLAFGMKLPGLLPRANALGQLPALGLLTLAGMTPESWTQSYHEAAKWDEELIECIVQQTPTVAALSALTASIQEAYQLAGELRKRNVPVILGGLHATTCPDEARRYCDAVVVGEGEPVWAQVLHDAQCGKLQQIYRANEPFDLQVSGTPRFDLLPAKKVPRWTIQTQRGCPFACDFCGASRLLGPFREKPLENIQREMEAIRQVDSTPWLELADDNTFAGARDTEQLCAVLGDAGVHYFTEVDWRIGERPELLRQLAASGCVQVLLGIESLVFRYPGMGAKQADLERIMNAVSAIQDAGVGVNGCFIVGAEGETNESLDRMIDFVLNSQLAEVQMTLQTPFPGTGLYERLKKAGRLLRDRDWSHYTLFDVTYRPDCMTIEELEAGFRRVLAATFCSQATEHRSQLRREILTRSRKLRGAIKDANRYGCT